jgi:hypothetical protein
LKLKDIYQAQLKDPDICVWSQQLQTRLEQCSIVLEKKQDHSNH